MYRTPGIQWLIRYNPISWASPIIVGISSVQEVSRVRHCVTSWTAAHQASLSITNSQSLLKLMSNWWCHLIIILCHPLLLLPSIFPSIRVLSNESTLHIRWPKYWTFNFNISPSTEHSGLISFRLDWLTLLAVQFSSVQFSRSVVSDSLRPHESQHARPPCPSPIPGVTLNSLLQHHSWKESILWCSAFFIVQLSYPYMTTGKTIALTRWTFVDKVMSLLFNMLSRLVITFLPRSKCLLISWLQSPSAMILEPKKIVSHCFPIYLSWSDGTICHGLSFLNVEP